MDREQRIRSISFIFILGSIVVLERDFDEKTGSRSNLELGKRNVDLLKLRIFKSLGTFPECWDMLLHMECDDGGSPSRSAGFLG